MHKLVVLCALLAAAVAEPGLLHAPLAYSGPLAAPLAYSGAIAAPASTYINPAAGVIQPTIYSHPYGLAHFIKKRSAPIAYSAALAPSAYLTTAPLATTYTAPLVSSAPIYPLNPIAYSTAAHFIKKRGIAFTHPATYVAPATYAATAPYVSTAYGAPVYSTPYISAAPVAYPAHLIKKRSAQIAYAAPAISHQSRIDYTGPVVSSYAAISPIGYPAVNAYGYSALGPVVV